MSKDNKAPAKTTAPAQAQNQQNQNQNQGQGGGGGHHGAKSIPPAKAQVVHLPGMCIGEDCKQKSQKAGFCMEHFDWFKEGLLTREGRKPSDFEKKHFDYQRRKKKAA